MDQLYASDYTMSFLVSHIISGISSHCQNAELILSRKFLYAVGTVYI